MASNGASANIFGAAQLVIPNYAGSGFKSVLSSDGSMNATGSAGLVYNRFAQWKQTAAISRVAVSSAAFNNIKAGSRMTIFGA
jgi:hypothetical protein